MRTFAAGNASQSLPHPSRMAELLALAVPAAAAFGGTVMGGGDISQQVGAPPVFRGNGLFGWLMYRTLTRRFEIEMQLYIALVRERTHEKWMRTIKTLAYLLYLAVSQKYYIEMVREMVVSFMKTPFPTTFSQLIAAITLIMLVVSVKFTAQGCISGLSLFVSSHG